MTPEATVRTPAGFAPQHDGYAERVRASFARQRVMDWIGAEMTRVEPGCCEIRLPYRPELSQQHGYFHGGIVGAIADSAAGYAGMTLMPEDASVLTVEYKVNLMAPADGESLIARGEVVRPGRTLIVSRAEVVVVRDGREHPCAAMLQTLMTLHGRPDEPASRASAGASEILR